jgi:hypothetical protein
MFGAKFVNEIPKILCSNFNHIVALMQNFQLVHLTLRTSCILQNVKLMGCETKRNDFFIKNVLT